MPGDEGPQKFLILAHQNLDMVYTIGVYVQFGGQDSLILISPAGVLNLVRLGSNSQEIHPSLTPRSFQA